MTEFDLAEEMKWFLHAVVDKHLSSIPEGIKLEPIEKEQRRTSFYRDLCKVYDQKGEELMSRLPFYVKKDTLSAVFFYLYQVCSKKFKSMLENTNAEGRHKNSHYLIR